MSTPLIPVRPAAPAPDPAAVRGDTSKLAAAAQQFEAMALGQMLAPMFNTVDSSHGLFGGGEGEEAWKPMMVDALAKDMARAGGLGLAAPVLAQMMRMQEAKK